MSIFYRFIRSSLSLANVNSVGGASFRFRKEWLPPRMVPITGGPKYYNFYALCVFRVSMERIVRKKYLISVRTGCARYSVKYLSSLANNSSNVSGWSI